MRSKLELEAMTFATIAHKNQTRKYTGELYIGHPWEVAEIVRSTALRHPYQIKLDVMLAAAWLHDVVEDCGVTAQEIEDLFGSEVAKMVVDLSDVTTLADGNRAKRKAIECERLSKISNSAKTVKLADMISNSRSIIEHDPDFAKVYMAEKRALLESLKGGDLQLWVQANDIIEDWERNQRAVV